MIRHLFKANVLGAMLLTAVMVIAVSSVNQVQAQAIADKQSVASDATPKQPLSEPEFQDFKETMKDLIAETQSSSSLAEHVQAIRLEYYDNVVRTVVDGYSLEYSTEAAIALTEPLADKHGNGHQVDLEQLAEETLQLLQ